MCRHVTIKPSQLPRCIKNEVISLLKNKKDDSMQIYKHSGYEVWYWAKDLNVVVRCIN